MKKLALAFSSKDRVELTKQTLPKWPHDFDLFWCDGSKTELGRDWIRCAPDVERQQKFVGVTGGPDAAIVFSLTQMLNRNDGFTHIGLLENDVLLDSDWLEPTMALFDNPEGLPVGAVSARSYEDRVLIQRDQYAIMHNVGAGHIILTREAAQIVLANYRTGWWPENRAVFSQLSGLDIGKFAAFHHNEQMITADWSWDTILAAHGLATVALTPSKATMIGQELTLEQQGLKYATGKLVNWMVEKARDEAFNRFRANLIDIREGKLALPPVDHLLRTRTGSLIFPHHAHKHAGIFQGKWTTRWNQGCGPFTYVAGEGASFSIPIFGPCAFHIGTGKVVIQDDATGFNTVVDLTGQPEAVTISIPRDMQHGTVKLLFFSGACLVAIETQYEQPRMTGVSFDYSTLPPVQEKP